MLDPTAGTTQLICDFGDGSTAFRQVASQAAGGVQRAIMFQHDYLPGGSHVVCLRWGECPPLYEIVRPTCAPLPAASPDGVQSHRIGRGTLLRLALILIATGGVALVGWMVSRTYPLAATVLAGIALTSLVIGALLLLLCWATSRRLPSSQPPRGLGDYVQVVTKAMGIQPCAKCHERARLLNQLTQAETRRKPTAPESRPIGARPPTDARS